MPISNRQGSPSVIFICGDKLYVTEVTFHIMNAPETVTVTEEETTIDPL